MFDAFERILLLENNIAAKKRQIDQRPCGKSLIDALAPRLQNAPATEGSRMTAEEKVLHEIADALEAVDAATLPAELKAALVDHLEPALELINQHLYPPPRDLTPPA